ncbi:MAG: MBL fold metallo-hydrolase [Synergistaceae bacterium]|nr:MBL fold metallo-hydrolase [Synergistaceae bacterium]
MLKVKVLVDNSTLVGKYYTGEPGFCLWLDESGKKILFDTGYSDIFIKNAVLMGIDPADADTVVLSHGHSDHTWGLSHYAQYMHSKGSAKRARLIAHPLALDIKRIDGAPAGITFSRETLEENFMVTLSSEPLKITDKLMWLGTIPHTVEPEKALGKIVNDGVETDDFCHDDSALVYEADGGIVIITGCSHSGICNIIAYAKRLTGKDKILDVLGGFHMQNVPKEEMERTVDWLAQAAPVKMHPCHCTDFKARAAIARRIDVDEVGVGSEFCWE